MSKNAYSIYEAINIKTDLEGLVTGSTKEGLYLEFKTKTNPEKPDLDNDDKRNFSESISQFANSDGGVLIFGVKTNKPNDCASALVPINNPAEFERRLFDFLPHAIQPSVDGISSKVIKDHDDGYVLFYIPESNKAPHRSMVSREYLKRNQTGKYKMEHFDLEDMFGRRQKPLLKIDIQLPKEKISTTHLLESTDQIYLNPVNCEIYIHNEGRYIAKNTLVIITLPDENIAKFNLVPINGGDFNFTSITQLRSGKPTLQLALHNHVFYPGLHTRIAMLETQLARDEFDQVEDLVFSYEVYAEDMQKIVETIKLSIKNAIN